MNNDNTKAHHPLYGAYDRVFFDEEGRITPKSYFLDGRGIMIKLGNKIIDLDHMHTRNDIIGQKDPTDKVDFPTFRMFDGEADVFGYNVVFGSSGNTLAKPAKFAFLSRLYNKQMTYLGGLSTDALDQNGNWRGIQITSLHAWVRWVEQVTEHDKEAFTGLQQWLNKCKTSTTMRLSQTSSNILAEARRSSIKLVNNVPKKEEEIKLIEPPKIAAVIVTTPPIPVPLCGKLSEIEKISGELVAIG